MPKDDVIPTFFKISCRNFPEKESRRLHVLDLRAKAWDVVYMSCAQGSRPILVNKFEIGPVIDQEKGHGKRKFWNGNPNFLAKDTQGDAAVGVATRHYFAK